jgi:hypothetical protein
MEAAGLSYQGDTQAAMAMAIAAAADAYPGDTLEMLGYLSLWIDAARDEDTSDTPPRSPCRSCAANQRWEPSSIRGGARVLVAIGGPSRYGIVLPV